MVKPLFNPELRGLLVEIKRKNEITIDHVCQDKVIAAGFSAVALERARTVVQSFEKFIQDHKDEITALQVLFSVPYRTRLRYEDIVELAERIQSVFNPIAPAMLVYPEEPSRATAELRPASRDGLRIVRWRHYGVRVGTESGGYQSTREFVTLRGEQLPAGWIDPVDLITGSSTSASF